MEFGRYEWTVSLAAYRRDWRAWEPLPKPEPDSTAEPWVWVPVNLKCPCAVPCLHTTTTPTDNIPSSIHVVVPAMDKVLDKYASQRQASRREAFLVATHLQPHEEYWKAKRDLLRERGYHLRPRFQPGWTAPFDNPEIRSSLARNHRDINPVRSHCSLGCLPLVGD